MAGSNDDFIQETKGTNQVESQAFSVNAKAALKAVEAGHAKDVDIAAQILADYADEDQNWTKEEEKRLIRKVDWMIVPIVSFLIHSGSWRPI